MADLIVSSGQISSGLVIAALETLIVRSGGEAIDTVISGGGVAEILSGGDMSRTTLIGIPGSSYASLYVAAGGTAANTVISGGGQEDLDPGATTLGSVVSSGGLLYAKPGAVTENTTVISGGTDDVTTVVSSGETLSGFTVATGGTVMVEYGGTALETTLDRGSYLVVSAGGAARDTLVLPTSATLATPSVYVESAGTATSTTLESGAGETVYGGGVTVGATVTSGGFESVSAGGTAVSTVVGSGGSLFLFSGGIASGTIVESGGSVFTDRTVLSGQIVSGLTVGPETVLRVESGGTALATRVSGGYITVSGGVVSGTIVLGAPEGNGGVYAGALDLEDGATAFATTAEGAATVDAYGSLVSGAVFLGLSGYTPILEVENGGTAISAALSSGGAAVIHSGGTGSDTTVLSGGALYVSSGGVVLDTVVSSGGTVIGSIPCFAAGTLILTERGDVAAENLQIGDRIATEDGTFEPVIWIGSRVVDCRRHPRPGQVLPVRILAGAFGPGRPRRDLYLSPDHAIFAEDVLIPARHLIDGNGVRQMACAQVTYLHVELPRHCVILAEGLATESYLDTGDRASFGGDGRVVTAHPVFGTEAGDVMLIAEARGYAPLRVMGPEVERVRDQLAARAAGAAGAAEIATQAGRVIGVTGPRRSCMN
jgi:collagen type I/II/III/V/XI/XXIV/XXVII alpha